MYNIDVYFSDNQLKNQKLRCVLLLPRENGLEEDVTNRLLKLSNDFSIL